MSKSISFCLDPGKPSDRLYVAVAHPRPSVRHAVCSTRNSPVRSPGRMDGRTRTRADGRTWLTERTDPDGWTDRRLNGSTWLLRHKIWIAWNGSYGQFHSFPATFIWSGEMLLSMRIILPIIYATLRSICFRVLSLLRLYLWLTCKIRHPAHSQAEASMSTECA